MTDGARVVSLRILVLSIVLAWLSKTAYWVGALKQAAAWPLHDFFFPRPLQRVDVALVAALLPLALAGWAVVRGGAARLRDALGALAAGSGVLLLHQLAFNDATFVTSLWAALYGLWLHRAGASASETVTLRAGMFAQLTIAMFFLGGLVGKLTPGYWDGSVIHGLYFARSQHWTFALARAQLSPAALMEVARWYARGLMLSELLLASLPLWPIRASLRFAALALVVLVALNNFKLVSVTAPLLGMCLVGLLLERAARSSA
ncbi:MAG: hypothetical protein ABW252_14270 [Polyangiales bacterium]